jgi:hypothetical protein
MKQTQLFGETSPNQHSRQKYDLAFLNATFKYEGGVLLWKTRFLPRSPAGSIVQTFINNYGYLQVYGTNHVVSIIIRCLLDQRQILDHETVDHFDRNPSNNHPDNLRFATRLQQILNQGKRQGCTSQFKGVSWDKATQKWKAQISQNRKKKYLGSFDREIDAFKAYTAVARRTHDQEFHTLV